MMSYEDYQALPASIRKKFFSTQERISIERQAAAGARKRQPSKAKDASKSTTQPAIRPGPNVLSSKPSQRRVSRIAADQYHVSEDQALWYLSLPDKLKRQHFSKEEQAALLDRCQGIIRSQSVDLTQRIEGRGSTTPLRRHCSQTVRRRCSVPASTADSEQSKGTIRPSSVVWQDVNFGEGGVTSVPVRYDHIEAADPADLPPPLRIKQQHTRKKSFQGTRILRPLPLPAPRLAPFPSPGFYQDSDKPAKLRRRSSESHMLRQDLDRHATFYRDPEARRTLRTFISPELFDEALEYGFPTQNKNDEPPAHAGADQAEHMRNFSLTSESTRDTTLTSIQDSQPATPRSPTNPTEPTISRNSTSFESDAMSPTSLHHILHQGKAPFSNYQQHRRNTSSREMTLRMTLTRPELRSTSAPTSDTGFRSLSSDDAYSNTGARSLEDRDPLALEELPVCDDATGAHGAFAVREGEGEGKGILKVWKNLRKK